MSAPLVPSPLDYVGRRRFAFYPPIQGVQPNDWVLGSSSWAEVQVINTATRQQLWIKRIYICGVSDRSGLPLVVELSTDLDLSGTSIRPHSTEVIEIPLTASDRKRKRDSTGPAAVIAIRIEQETARSRKWVGRIFLVALAAAIVAVLVLAAAKL